jgi:hypothetical protein
VWHRLNYFKSLKAKNRVGKSKKPGYPLVGVLGCMAERLKTSLLEEESVDFVCGPDAYRDVPLLVEIAATTDQKAANVQLSLEETYADISPVRQVSSTSAFVSIMRGCNNMCACKLRIHPQYYFLLLYARWNCHVLDYSLWFTTDAFVPHITLANIIPRPLKSQMMCNLH